MKDTMRIMSSVELSFILYDVDLLGSGT